MSDDLLRAFATTVGRNKTMLKIALGMSAGVATLLGVRNRASAFACCSLCNPTGGCTYSCSWCWNCMDISGQCWSCCEGYVAGQSCAGGCPSACSWAFTVPGPC